MIDLKVLSEEEIQSMSIGDEDLWLVKHGQKTYGPFETTSLKYYLTARPDFVKEILCTNRQLEDWKSPALYTELSNRKKPQLQSADQLKKFDHYLVLKDGQKMGPFTHDDVKSKLHEGEFHEADLISDDEGMSWHKFFVMTAFHSHKLVLPGCGPDHDLSNVRAEVLDHLAENIDPIKEGMIGLAFIGQQKLGKGTTKLEEVEIKHVHIPAADQSKVSGRLLATAFSFTLTIVGVYFWWSSLSRNTPAPQLADTEQGNSLTERVKRITTRRGNFGRQPSSYSPGKTGSSLSAPPTMMGGASSFNEYRETHEDFDYNRPVDTVPMDVDNGGSDQTQSLVQPSGQEDGYHFEDSNADANPPVQDVGDF